MYYKSFSFFFSFYLSFQYNKAKSLSPQVHYARISPYSQTVDSRSWSTFYSEATLSENFDLLPHLCLHLVWKEDADPRGSHVWVIQWDVDPWGGEGEGGGTLSVSYTYAMLLTCFLTF